MEGREIEGEMSARMFGGELSIYNSALSDGLLESVMDVLLVWCRFSVFETWNL